MTLHKEISFEDEVCTHLGVNGWLYEAGDNAKYDTARALFPPDLLEWIRVSQPKAWDALAKAGGSKAETMFLDRVRKQIEQRGTLDVLRKGVEMIGVKGALKLAEFKPALAENSEIVARYEANRLRIVRQVRYSLANQNCLDLVLFLNGIPVATVELKTDFTQSVGDAIDQYRFDRLPKLPGQAAEPLLKFPSGAFVHFAVSNREVHMATKLEGKDTVFLPFNRGDNGGKGNSPNPHGHPTSYLWEEVWERDSWLELIGRYITPEKDEKEEIKKIIFPRFHQLDATRKLVRAVLTEGPGSRYLIQHSAGSGKTNSIAWTAHFLADLHDAKKQKLFNTVIVVSDRKVIDGQLQKAIFDFERTTGVVASIRGDGGNKSAELAEALGGGKKIVVCTIQTFPFALRAVRELAATKGKTFAVIADEAHSSQTGEAAAKLKQTLSAAELEELEEGGEVSTEDILAAQMKSRADESGITYVAFTATPKAKTLELFGRRPNPEAPTGEDNLPRPFHLYSMRQAIEEGFILDVLQNYTPYSLAFRLAQEGKVIDSDEVERSAAMKKLMSWVRLHPHNISQKVRIVVEHYRANVAPLLAGKAKAMVVLASRKEAVRWKIAIDKYIKDQGYGIGTLVAFSGSVSDHETGPEPFTEEGKGMNPDLKGRDITGAFATDEFHILLVANKFQTGFDQPLLSAMYVDRRLAGIQAVQTLSRLNRAYKNGHVVKDTTYVLDFSDSSSDVLKAFSQYYGEAMLEDVTDPNLIFDLRAKLDGAGRYDDFEVQRVVRAELDPASKQSDLVKTVEPVASRLMKQFADARAQLLHARTAGDEVAEKAAQQIMDALILFRSDMQVFIRVYGFLSQIFDYQTTAIEKRAIFFRYLVPLLEFGREREGVDLSKLALTHHKLSTKGATALTPTGEDPDNKLKPLMAPGTGQVRDPENVRLEEIIQRVNDLFEGELTEEHRLRFYEAVEASVLASDTLSQQAQNNSEEQFANSPDLPKAVTDAVIDAHGAFAEMSRQYFDDPKVQTGLMQALLGIGGVWDKLRQGGPARN